MKKMNLFSSVSLTLLCLSFLAHGSTHRQKFRTPSLKKVAQALAIAASTLSPGSSAHWTRVSKQTLTGDFVGQNHFLELGGALGTGLAGYPSITGEGTMAPLIVTNASTTSESLYSSSAIVGVSLPGLALTELAIFPDEVALSSAIHPHNDFVAVLVVSEKSKQLYQVILNSKTKEVYRNEVPNYKETESSCTKVPFDDLDDLIETVPPQYFPTKDGFLRFFLNRWDFVKLDASSKTLTFFEKPYGDVLIVSSYNKQEDVLSACHYEGVHSDIHDNDLCLAFKEGELWKLPVTPLEVDAVPFCSKDGKWTYLDEEESGSFKFTLTRQNYEGEGERSYLHSLPEEINISGPPAYKGTCPEGTPYTFLQARDYDSGANMLLVYHEDESDPIASLRLHGTTDANAQFYNPRGDHLVIPGKTVFEVYHLDGKTLRLEKSFPYEHVTHIEDDNDWDDVDTEKAMAYYTDNDTIILVEAKRGEGRTDPWTYYMRTFQESDCHK